MNKQKRLVVGLFGTVMVIVIVLLMYLVLKDTKLNFLPVKKTVDLVDFPDNPSKGQPGYQETETATSTGEEGRLAGNFKEMRDSSLVYISEGEDMIVTVNDEIALQCTEENLNGVARVDLNNVKEVKLLNFDGLRKILIAGQPIFMIAEQSGGNPKVHTIFVSKDTCTKV